jgi:hypothetical protein
MDSSSKLRALKKYAETNYWSLDVAERDERRLSYSGGSLGITQQVTYL